MGSEMCIRDRYCNVSSGLPSNLSGDDLPGSSSTVHRLTSVAGVGHSRPVRNVLLHIYTLPGTRSGGDCLGSNAALISAHGVND